MAKERAYNFQHFLIDYFLKLRHTAFHDYFVFFTTSYFLNAIVCFPVDVARGAINTFNFAGYKPVNRIQIGNFR